MFTRFVANSENCRKNPFLVGFWGGVFPIYYNITWGESLSGPQFVLRNIWTARQYHQVLTGTAPLLTQYHKVQTSIAIKRQSTINYQLVPPMLTQCHQDHCCPILTQYTASSPRNALLNQTDLFFLNFSFKI